MWYFGFPPEPPEDNDEDDNRGHIALGWVLVFTIGGYAALGLFAWGLGAF